MDLIKVGKLIAKLRKEKGMTQDELADKFEITGKSVSKWERGINAPDISILKSLSEELGISIEELLSGELNTGDNLNNGDIMIDSIKYYNNLIKHKNSIKVLFLIIILVFVFSLVFTINNYNKFSIYSIISDDSRMTLDGYIIFNQSEKIMVLNDIAFTSGTEGTQNDLKAKNVNLKLMSGNKVIFYIYSKNDFGFEYLSFILSTISANVTDKNDNNQSIISKKDLKNMYLVIEYDDIYEKTNDIKLKIKTNQEFSNNRLFY